MKKIALLCLAAVFVIGIQSCSKDELPLDQQEDIVVDKLTTEDAKSFFCNTKIYVRYNPTWDPAEKQEFEGIARKFWFRYVLVQKTDCPSIDIWNVPCDQVPLPKNKDKAVVDAENSGSIGEGDAPPPHEYGDSPAYDNDDNTDYGRLCNFQVNRPTPTSTPKTPINTDPLIADE